MKVFVTRSIPESGLQLLTKHHTVSIYPSDHPPSKQEIIEGLQGHQGLLCLLTDPIDQEVITSEPQLQMIANYAVGIDNIDVETATKKGIPVSNTPGVLTDATAELAWALVFSVGRRIVEADQFTRKNNFNGWAPKLMLGIEFEGKTLGIIGAGRIGTAMALKSKGFNMNVVYTSRSHNTIIEKTLDAQKLKLNELIQQADIISIHVPLTDKTHHLIGKEELAMMKSSTILVNTSRGPVIDEHELIQALQKKQIFGAGLDVFEEEPAIPKNLRNLDNVVVLPHIGSATYETRSNMAVMAAQNMVDGLAGRQPKNCVNPTVFQ